MSATKKLVDAFGRTFEERKAEADLMERANKEARDNWDNPAWRQEFAQELTESILLGFEYETLIDRFIETERLGFDGRSFIRETTGLKAFWMARGGYIEASELTAEVSELPRDMIGVHVYEFEDKFLTNFSESAQTLRNLAIRRMDAEINRRHLAVLQEAVPSGSAYYISAAGLSQASLDTAIRQVRDATEQNEVTIVGRSTMTDQIAGFPNFADEAKEEIRLRGVLGRYRGATIVTLRNFKDEEGVPYFPANELWVLATDHGKFAFYGGLMSKEFSELNNWYWHYLARRDAGVMVHQPSRVRRVVDTSQAA